MSNLIKRTLSGIVYIAVVICSIIFSQYATEILFLAIAMLAVREYHILMKSDRKVTVWSIVLASCLYMQHVSVLHETSNSTISGHPLVWQLLFGILLIIALAAELFRKADNPMRNWGNILISLGMIALPLSLTNDILALGDWATQKYILLSIFVCIWVNDTGAYCVGSLLGKHKMFPRVSPGKSWEGLVGGFIASLLTGYVFSLFISEYDWIHWLLIAFTVSLFGTFGDLMESLLKRTIGVKDSGVFMPGHGGVLDRFDSILLCLPAIYLLLRLILAI